MLNRQIVCQDLGIAILTFGARKVLNRARDGAARVGGFIVVKIVFIVVIHVPSGRRVFLSPRENVVDDFMSSRLELSSSAFVVCFP